MPSAEAIGIKLPTILLPRPSIDLSRWAVIACDQFTSQPEYWEKVEEIVGDAPSTFRMILPEVYLDTPEESARTQSIQNTMSRYLNEQILQPFEGMIYVERSVDGKTRRGLMLCLDLECYDFNKGSKSLIRATEGTILDRLPPRMRIRAGAPLELPHILVLIDDPQRTVLEPVGEIKHTLPKAYDFDLMLGSGHLTGYQILDEQIIHQIISGLERLADPDSFQRKYTLDSPQPVLLFAMGDGNHSLATAKAIWDQLKPQVGMDHPARYALVEIENVHDEGLVFEPIHRVVFKLRRDIIQAFNQYYPGKVNNIPVSTEDQMVSLVNNQADETQKIGLVVPGGFSVVEISNPPSNLPVGTLQAFLDAFLKEGGAEKIDYVHGEDVVTRLGGCPECAGFFLPGMKKGDLFKTVILDGALPRKTFSMGEAHEKRFYLESRRIA